MKLLFIILTICLFSCNDGNPHVKEITISLNNGYGWLETIRCDSATMISIKEADFWVDGHKHKVFATECISISR